jgi:hypothetical protein
MEDITSLIERESDLKAQLKDLRKDLNEMLEKTAVYKSYSEQLTLDERFSKKVVKSHSLKLAYETFKPKDDDAE